MKNTENILKQLYFINEWWTTGEVAENKKKEFKRRDFRSIKNDLEKLEIKTIIGPRQVGKTTIIYQIIDYLIKEGIDSKKVNPKNILFLNMDNQVIKINSDDFLEDTLEIYFKEILKTPIKETKEKVYLILDEIQSLENWSKKLKNWYDHKLNIKIIISGSSSTQIQKGGKESLAGRMETQLILPLKFIEILNYKNICEINKTNWKIRDKLVEAIKLKAPVNFYNDLQTIKKELIPFEEKIQIELEKYMLAGGYPGLLEITDKNEIAKKLTEYIEATIYKDIITLHNIRDPDTLRSINALIAQNGIKTISKANLAKNLGIRVETINSNLEYLKEAFLITESEISSKNITIRKRNPKKICFRDAGIRNAILNQINDETMKNATEMGLIAEIIAYDHLRRLTFNLKNRNIFRKEELNYWKNSFEIDIVLETTEGILPIEIKYSDNIQSQTIKNINSFVEKNNSPFGIIVTKNTLDLRDKVILLPLWLLLIMC